MSLTLYCNIGSVSISTGPLQLEFSTMMHPKASDVISYYLAFIADLVPNTLKSIQIHYNYFH